MRLASICIRKANSRHNTAGSRSKLPAEAAEAQPSITGTAAPVSVLGRAASIHARKELVAVCVLIFPERTYALREVLFLYCLVG